MLLNKLTAEARDQRGPTRQRHKTGDGIDRRELTDGEVYGGSVLTTVLYSPTHIEW